MSAFNHRHDPMATRRAEAKAKYDRLQEQINKDFAHLTEHMDATATSLQALIHAQYDTTPNFDRFTERYYPNLATDNVMNGHLKFTYIAAYKEGLEDAFARLRKDYFIGPKAMPILVVVLIAIAFTAGYYAHKFT